MTCTTFLHDGELNQRLPDAEVQAALEEVRRRTGRDWQIVPLPERRIGWFGRKKAPDLYGLYVYVGGMGPWQQINFYRADTSWSINLYMPIEVIASYIYGILSGMNRAEQKAKENV